MVLLSREYRQVITDLTEVQDIARQESDRELASLAREEISDLQDRKGHLEHQLRIELIPKDPNDEKNVIVEVRAGTGGEEAGLFAAEMYRMYIRYAQRVGWDVDVINSNENGLCLLYTSPSPRDATLSRMPSSA